MHKTTIVLFSGALALTGAQASAQMSMPTDAMPTCTTDIGPWFSGGAPSVGGAVMPPSSVTFTADNPNGGQGPNLCNFFEWGAQMFLWLTSPDDGGLVLDGPAIYNVLPEVTDSKGVKTRALQDASTASALAVALRAQKDDVAEVGQAGGGGTLLSQKGSLVYYGVHVSDIYAGFLTGQKAGQIAGDPVDFPHDGADLQAVIDYMNSALPGDPAQAPETLAMELKTSWVDASTLSDPGDYITMPAMIPSYTADASNQTWTPGAAVPATLALVGIHIVGTVQDHPEFVWATFEHINNAPDVAYWYENMAADVVQWPYSSTGAFTFLATGAPATGANVECAKTASGSAGAITAAMSDASPACAGGIVASNTVRTRPWGSEPYGPADVGTNGITTAQVNQIVANNTLLLSINGSVRMQLDAGDARKNYVQTGGIWTTTPAGGGDAPIPNQTGSQAAQMRGSLGLYNSTMETYSESFANNCFVCHSLTGGAANSFGADELSHIYSEIIALPVQ